MAGKKGGKKLRKGKKMESKKPLFSFGASNKVN